MPHSIELAALLAAHAPHFVEGSHSISDAILEQLRCASRARLHGWMRRLDGSLLGDSAKPRSESSLASEAERVIQEILQSEMLTRTLAAILSCADSARGLTHAEPFARQIFVDQLQARHRALSYLVGETRLPPARLVAFDRLRRKVERWVDMLLGQIAARYNVTSYAFDADRLRDYAGSSLLQPQSSVVGPVWGFLLAGLELAFPISKLNEDELPAAHPDGSDEEHAFLQTVIAAIPPDAFHHDGPFKSVLALRIGRSGARPESPAHRPAAPSGHTSDAAPPQSSASKSPLSFAKLRAKQGGRSSDRMS